jgi:hypothetical protein
MNYVIRVFDNSLIENEWIHEFTKETYKDVFRLGSVWDFPEYLNENDEFYFNIDENKNNDLCAVCEAYSPTPEKIIYINIC